MYRANTVTQQCKARGPEREIAKDPGTCVDIRHQNRLVQKLESVW